MTRKASEAALAYMRQEQAKQNDWWGKCPKCGTIRRGTPKEVTTPCECANGRDDS